MHPWKTVPETKQLQGSRGFSLLELTIVVLIVVILGSIGALSLRGIQTQFQADSVGSQALGLFREVHERAIAERRNYQLQLSNGNQFRIVRLNVPSGSTVIKTEVLIGGAQFQLFGGLPDTPDAFGNSGAISFGGSSTLNFISDGTLVDNSGSPLNGTLFFGISSDPKSAQAITVLGSTGRIQLYRWSGTQWIK